VAKHANLNNFTFEGQQWELANINCTRTPFLGIKVDWFVEVPIVIKQGIPETEMEEIRQKVVGRGEPPSETPGIGDWRQCRPKVLNFDCAHVGRLHDHLLAEQVV